MRNVLIIGGAGFVGSHLCERLSKNCNVVSLDDYSTGSEKNHIFGVKYINASSETIDFIPKPDIVYHLGEYSRVLTSFDDIESVVRSEIGTLKVLEYCRRNKVKLVYAGSSTKFGDKESPYSFFKAHNTELVKKYGEWFGLEYAITYFYNVYGGREIKEGKYATVIGVFETNRKNGVPHTINGDGSQKRAFTHIDDIIDGLLLVESGEYCIGSDEEYSIYEVAQMFGGEIILSEEKKGDRTRSSIDVTRIKKLGWEAKHSLKEYVNSL